MKSFTIAFAATAAVLGLFTSSVTADSSSIVIKGSHFFYQNGTEFFMKGIAYQQDVGTNGTTSGTATFTDPLADPVGCARDIPLLQQLGTNVIRVYAVNSSADHSKCMSMLQAAGIYVLQDLSNPSASINRLAPKWDVTLFASYAAVIDNMAQYPNLLGFFAGNEVSNEVTNTNASAYVKAAVRDSKAYIKAKGYRSIGVGYATNDDAAIRINLANYFNCGDPASAIDFWGYNIYSWCGSSSYTISGYDQRTAEFANYSVPAFFAEYGCNTVQPRVFTEVQALYGPNMTNVWSGGVLYMYFQETNDYGLVSVTGSTVSKLPDFAAFSSQINQVAPSGTSSAAYTVSNTVARACPTLDSTWSASSNLPPIANIELCNCMVASLSCVAKSGLTSNATATLFNYVCGQDNAACNGIQSNGTTGKYGTYSMCLPSQQLSYVMNQYYLDHGKTSDSCNFNNQASVQSGSVSSSCSPLLGQAGTAGTGSVTSIPTGAVTAAAGTASTGSASTSSGSAVGSTIIPRFDVGLLQLGAYLVVAGMAGAGIILM